MNDKMDEVLFQSTDEDKSGRKHVLVIDDDRDTLWTMRYYLQDEYRVSAVSSAKVAIDFLLKYTPDAIILDYMMPMFNGATVMKIIKSREATKDIPVLFLTGQMDKAVVMECLSLQPAGYLVKPVTKAALLEKLKTIV